MLYEIGLVFGIIITIVSLAILLLISKKGPKSRKETDYRALFNMGIIFFPAGLAISVATRIINPLLILGLVYFIMSLANKDKWKPHEK